MSGPVRNESSGEPGNVIQAGNIGMAQVNTPPLRPPEPPRQFPPTHPKYTNRSRELSEIAEVVREIADTGRGRRMLLAGRAGIGKSALLAELMHTHQDAFPEGVLHVDMAKYRDREGNADYSAALDSVLRQLGVAAGERPSDLAGLQDKLNQVTTARRILVGLDDAADGGEVDVFTLGGGAHLLVAACRESFPDHASQESDKGAEVLRLERLDDADGLQLLRACIKTADRTLRRGEEDSARQLVALCGGLPPVLRMAAAHLNARPELTSTGLVEAVRAQARATPGTPAVDAVTALFMGGLTHEQMELLSRLAAHPGRFFPTELAAVVMGSSAPKLLRELAEASVVRPAGADNYGIVELVRAEARRRRDALPKAKARAANEAILRFFTVSHMLADTCIYGERFRLADSLGASQFTVAPADYRPQFESTAEAADWQDRHVGHTPGLMRMAVDLGFPQVALLLADATWPTYYGRRRFAVGTSVYAYAAQIARTNDLHAGLARCLCYLARLHLALGGAEAAEQHLTEAEPAAERSGDSLNRAVVLETYGLLKRHMRSPDKEAALSLLTEARAIHRERRRPRGEALQTYQIGDFCRELGDLDRSLAELTAAEEIAAERLAELGEGPRSVAAVRRVNGWALLWARIRLAQARTLQDKGEPAKAETAATLAQNYFADEHQPVKEAEALRLLVELAERRGDAAARRELLTRAHLIYTHFHLVDEANEVRSKLEQE